MPALASSGMDRSSGPTTTCDAPDRLLGGVAETHRKRPRWRTPIRDAPPDRVSEVGPEIADEYIILEVTHSRRFSPDTPSP